MRTLHASDRGNPLVTHFDSSRSLSLTNTRVTFDRLLGPPLVNTSNWNLII